MLTAARCMLARTHRPEKFMPPRLDFRKESSQGLAALYQLEKYLTDSGLERAKASSGFTRSPPGAKRRFPTNVRAALAFTEAVTRIADHREGDVVHEELRRPGVGAR